jgi:hypothetical protein
LLLFNQQFKKLSDRDQHSVAEGIDLIVDNPLLGEEKKGDLSNIRVHIVPLKNTQVLLGYTCQARQITLYLLRLGSQANFHSS